MTQVNLKQMTGLFEYFNEKIWNHDEYFTQWKNWESEYRDIEFQKSVKLNLAIPELMKCKTLFYPGAGYDFSTLKFYMEMSGIKDFYYCDYLNFDISKEKVYANLIEQLAPFGFLVQHVSMLNPEFFNQAQWSSYWHPSEEARFGGDIQNSFISLYRIIKGGRKFNLYYFGTEAIRTYEILLKNNIKMDVVVTQDHGLGGLWTTFCKGSILENLSNQYDKEPKLLMVGEDYKGWSKYAQLTESFGKFGLHEHSRIFFKLFT